jgi:hypothetical protein
MKAEQRKLLLHASVSEDIYAAPPKTAPQVLPQPPKRSPHAIKKTMDDDPKVIADLIADAQEIRNALRAPGGTKTDRDRAETILRAIEARIPQARSSESRVPIPPATEEARRRKQFQEQLLEEYAQGKIDGRIARDRVARELARERDGSYNASPERIPQAQSSEGRVPIPTATRRPTTEEARRRKQFQEQLVKEYAQGKIDGQMARDRVARELARERDGSYNASPDDAEDDTEEAELEKEYAQAKIDGQIARDRVARELARERDDSYHESPEQLKKHSYEAMAKEKEDAETRAYYANMQAARGGKTVAMIRDYGPAGAGSAAGIGVVGMAARNASAAAAAARTEAGAAEPLLGAVPTFAEQMALETEALGRGSTLGEILAIGNGARIGSQRGGVYGAIMGGALMAGATAAGLSDYAIGKIFGPPVNDETNWMSNSNIARVKTGFEALDHFRA